MFNPFTSYLCQIKYLANVTSKKKKTNKLMSYHILSNRYLQLYLQLIL